MSKHGFEQYLAKYISKPEPSCSIKLPENASEPERFLRTHVIGAVEALEILMGFHQNQMSRQVVFLQTELNPRQRMLKPNYQLRDLEEEDSDIYLQTKFQTYFNRPAALHALTYPEFYRWWRSATTAEQKKVCEGDPHNLHSKGSNDFQDFVHAKERLENAQTELSELLSQCDSVIGDEHDLWALKKALKIISVPQAVIDGIEKHYSEVGVDSLPADLNSCATEASSRIAKAIVGSIDWQDSELISGLCSHHWLLGNLRDYLIDVLTRYKPGSVLQDSDGHYWYRRAKMVCTRHRFISCVGDDDQEKYYQQKYLLTVPITSQSEVVLNPPDSWVELCVSEGMCDEHLDAMSCMQSAVSRGFHTDALRELAQVYIEHGFLCEDEADMFLSEIPVFGESEESQCTVSDQMLDTGDSNLVPECPASP